MFAPSGCSPLKRFIECQRFLQFDNDVQSERHVPQLTSEGNILQGLIQ